MGQISKLTKTSTHAKSSTSMEQKRNLHVSNSKFQQNQPFNGTNYKNDPRKSVTKIPPLIWNKIKIYIRQNIMYTSKLIDFQNYYKISHSDGIKIKLFKNLYTSKNGIIGLKKV